MNETKKWFTALFLWSSFLLFSFFAVSSSAQTLTWTGAAGDGLASTAGNWDDNRVPAITDSILLDGNVSQSNLVWDAVAVHSVVAWTQNTAYTGTVTVMTVYHAQAAGYGNFTSFTITGDCVLNNGVLI